MVDFTEPISVVVYALYRGPFLSGHGDDMLRFHEVMNEITSLDLPKKLHARQVTAIETRRLANEQVADDVVRLLLRRRGRLTKADVVIEVAATITPLGPSLLENPHGLEISDEGIRECDVSDAGAELVKTLQDLSFVLNLAAPRAVTLIRTAVAGDVSYPEFGEQRPLLSRLAYSRQPAWPVIRQLKASDVWLWWRSLPNWNDGFTADPITSGV